MKFQETDSISYSGNGDLNRSFGFDLDKLLDISQAEQDDEDLILTPLHPIIKGGRIRSRPRGAQFLCYMLVLSQKATVIEKIAR